MKNTDSVHSGSSDLERTYHADPPSFGLKSFGNAGEPPYSTGPGVVPRVSAPVPNIRYDKPQPVYHLQAKITPVARGDEPLRYKVQTGPDDCGIMHSYPLSGDPGAKFVGHLRPEIDPTDKMISIQPTVAQKLALPKTLNERVGAKVHMYSGDTAYHPSEFHHLFLNLHAEAVLDAVLGGKALEDDDDYGVLNEPHSSIPHKRYPHGQETPETRRSSIRSRFVDPSRMCFGCCCAEETAVDLELEAQHALEQELSLGLSADLALTNPTEIIPMETGYTRLMPNLVNDNDEAQPRVFNWIAPSGEIKSKEAKEQILDEAQETSRFFSKLKFWEKKPEEAETNQLVFQRSSTLANFLDEPGLGLQWEASDVGSDEEGDLEGIRPRIIYGGVEHCPPEFAGRLAPLTYQVSVIELHQYLQMAGQPPPWFMEQKLSPHQHALFGPAPLPFDPKFTGMPAPTIESKDTHHEHLPIIAPQIRSFFNLELPCVYEKTAIVAEPTTPTPKRQKKSKRKNKPQTPSDTEIKQSDSSGWSLSISNAEEEAN